jgi:hypothetical protein
MLPGTVWLALGDGDGRTIGAPAVALFRIAKTGIMNCA